MWVGYNPTQLEQGGSNYRHESHFMPIIAIISFNVAQFGILEMIVLHLSIEEEITILSNWRFFHDVEAT